MRLRISANFFGGMIVDRLQNVGPLGKSILHSCGQEMTPR